MKEFKHQRNPKPIVHTRTDFMWAFGTYMDDPTFIVDIQNEGEIFTSMKVLVDAAATNKSGKTFHTTYSIHFHP